MKKAFNCPICDSSTWQSIETYSYSRKDHLTPAKDTTHSKLLRKLHIKGRPLLFARPRTGLVHYDNALSSYQKLRREVLFDVWFKQSNEVQLKSVYCEACGFACYAPRPDDGDIARKYEYLKQHEPNAGGQAEQNSYAEYLDRKRALRIYEICSRYQLNKQIDVLDYGGGNGKLMRPFLERKHKCFLIDYYDNQLPGILKIGDDLNSYQTDAKFDTIICSHVLEHVSDVSKVVAKLKSLLKPEGIIYAEVPLEIWAGMEVEADPVTHINYFTKNSLTNLFLANGFEILEAKQQLSSYANFYLEVVWVVAKPSRSAATLLPPDIQKRLYPSRLRSLTKLFRNTVELELRRRLKR